MRIALAALAALAACSSPEGNTVEEKRDFVVKMNEDVLATFKKDEEKGAKLDDCVGYATFSNTSVTFLIAGGGGGYGLATHRESGRRTFMRIGSGNLGLGLGAKEYKMLMVFNTESAYQKFLQGGWTFGAEADATAKAGEDGGSADAAARAGEGEEAEVFQITDAGAILAATLQGGKFYRDDDLN